jgi:micrococcal nuclease
MAKIRLQGEWKMWAGFGILFLLLVGYLYMASRPPMEGNEYLWRVMSVVDGKTLVLRGSGQEFQFKLMGLKMPDSQGPAAKDFLTKALENQWVRIKTLRDQPDGGKEGLVYLSGEDVIARMVRQGLAQIDREEQAFDVRPYMELEQEAKREKRGLWREPAAEEK